MEDTAFRSISTRSACDIAKLHTWTTATGRPTAQGGSQGQDADQRDPRRLRRRLMSKIAEVAAWCNVSAPEPVKRKKNRAYVKDRLALADEVGARCAITYIGSLADGAEYQPHPDNLTQKGFDEFVECAREIIDDGQAQAGQVLPRDDAVELPDSPEVLLAADQGHRPAGLRGASRSGRTWSVSPRLYYDTTELIERCRRAPPGRTSSAATPRT